MIARLFSASVLILVVIALRRVLRGKICLRLQYSLWLLVALRLLIPFEFGSSPLSLQNFAPQADIYESVEVPQAPVQTRPQPSAPVVEMNPIPQTPQTIPIVPQSNLTSSQEGPTAPQTPVPIVPAVQSSATFDWKQFANLVWVLGACSMAIWFAAVNVHFRRKARRSTQQMQVENYPLPVFITSEIPSACLVGFVRPRVYLTPLADENSTTHVLTHELTHYRHFDPLWTRLRALCLCLYWFHPLVWWAAALSKRDCELACDEGALKILGEDQRIPYGKTLLSMVTHASRPHDLLQTATTMTESKKQLKERVEMIVKQPKKLAIALLCLLLVVGIAVGCTFTGAQSEATETTQATEFKEVPDSTVPTETKPQSQPEIVRVETYYENDNYRIPQFSEAHEFYKTLNEEILSEFGDVIEGKNMPYTSIDYEVYQNAEVLSLLIIADDGGEVPIYKSFNIDPLQHEHVYGLSAIDARKIRAERFVYDLIVRYQQGGSLSFDEATYENWKNNLFGGVEVWLDDSGSPCQSFLYYAPDAAQPERILIYGDAYERKIPEWKQAPQVVEMMHYDLYVYDDFPEVICRLPLLLMSGERAFEINVEILINYGYAYGMCEYSYSINGDIFSLLIFAHLDNPAYSIYNLSLSQGTELSHDEIYTAAGFTTESYMAHAKYAVETYYFDYWTTYTGIPWVNSRHYTLAANSAGYRNLSMCVPRLDENGKLWILTRIYQLAGAPYSLHMIPIEGGKITQGYMDFKSFDRTDLSLVPSFNLLGYYHVSLPEDLPNVMYFPSESEKITDATSYAIFENPYPIGHAGAAYAITPALREQQENNLRSYLSRALGEGDYALSYDADSEIQTSLYEGLAGHSFYGCPQGVGVRVDEHEILQELSVSELYDNQLMEAALHYAGIDAPVIQATHLYSTAVAFDGQIVEYQYTIYQQGDDATGRLCRSVSIRSDAQTRSLYISANKVQVPTQIASSNAPSYLDIVEAVADVFPDEVTPFSVEVYYSSDVILGCYEPCYRVYVCDRAASDIAGTTVYAVLELTEGRYFTDSES